MIKRSQASTVDLAFEDLHHCFSINVCHDLVAGMNAQRRVSSPDERALPSFKMKQSRKTVTSGGRSAKRSDPTKVRAEFPGARTFRKCNAIPFCLDYPFFRPFPRLVLGCINADFCDQGRIIQRLSSSTFFSSVCALIIKFNSSLHHSRFLIFFETFAPFN